MNAKLSYAVARWLAHHTGISQALVVTGIWIGLPIALHISLSAAIFWYLAFCTFISFATQFTLAYQNAKNEAANELGLRNQTDMMRLLVAAAERLEAFAERDAAHGDLVEQLHGRLALAVQAMDDEIESLARIAADAREHHERNGQMIEQLLARSAPIIEAAIRAAET